MLNQKGGVGKTTSTLNIGAGLARQGKKVLLIDLDPQANLSCSLGVDGDEQSATIYDVLAQESTLDSAIVKKNKLSVVPGSMILAAFEKEYAHKDKKEFILHNALQGYKDAQGKPFDYVVIDCAPSLGLLTLNALAAAHEVFIPVQSEYLALQGLSQLLETMKVVTLRINPQLKLGGLIATRYNRRRINNEVIASLRESFAEKVFKTVIRENVHLIEASSGGLDIFAYNPHSLGAQDYAALCKEIIIKDRAISSTVLRKSNKQEIAL